MDKLKLNVGFGVLVAEIYKNTDAGDRDLKEISITLAVIGKISLGILAVVPKRINRHTYVL